MTKYLTGLTLALLVAGCAQTQYKVELPADTDVRTAISEGDARIAHAYNEQWDILAKDELMKSSDALASAKKASADGKSQEKIVEQLSKFEMHYTQAQNQSSNRRERVQGLLEAREAALQSGIREYSKDDQRKFYKLDEDFRDMAESRRIDTEDYAELQQGYLKMATDMKKNVALGKARENIKFAIDNKGKRYAPQALNAAELDMKSAENMIDANLENPQAYQQSVERAKHSAGLVAAIVSEQKKVGYNLDERAAMRLVEQNGTLAQLNRELSISSTMLLGTQAEVDAQAEALRKADSERRFQQALADAQAQFSPNEADVYRQGDKILIRIKSMDFPTGNAQVPSGSRSVLDRVASVAQGLQAKEVVVEGHTDSTGSAQINDRLSQERAENVVDYLATTGVNRTAMQSVGYGFQKPISTNKSKEGRAQNRRVDVWITPQ
ncbi:OmpA family protein [Pseudobdellovibrio exovorus]|uniref:OmpA-like domain-containing protein n=1 Tax=Pseudobdellovibrio exovorus JSS TaxID=1184267 RepID=M4V5H7_9BACT|nr:OmpA family protein [Pseudobdellovibrio exovorus]AGH94592.1 hypothetical protein A11Q_372 [Pseudobdellovibrio exovorus JSS]